MKIKLSLILSITITLEKLYLDSTSSLNTVGLYSQMEFDYNDYIYFTLTARNDWASTVAEHK